MREYESHAEQPEAVGSYDGKITKGSKVKFMGATDEQVSWGANDDPRGLLEEGNVYTVETVETHRWHTKYYLKEFPGKKFNSVSFKGDKS